MCAVVERQGSPVFSELLIIGFITECSQIAGPFSACDLKRGYGKFEVGIF